MGVQFLVGTIKYRSDLDAMIEKSGTNPFFNVCTEEKFNKLMHTGMKKPPYIPGIFMDTIVSKKCARAGIEKIIYNEMIQEADLSDIVKKIKIPALIIWGEKDSIFNVDNAKLFQNDLKGSQVIIFKELGHVSLLEAPSKTAQVGFREYALFCKESKKTPVLESP